MEASLDPFGGTVREGLRFVTAITENWKSAAKQSLQYTNSISYSMTQLGGGGTLLLPHPVQFQSNHSRQPSTMPPTVTPKQNMIAYEASRVKKLASAHHAWPKCVTSPNSSTHQIALTMTFMSPVATSLPTRRWRRCPSAFRRRQAPRRDDGHIQQASLRLYIQRKQCRREGRRRYD